MVAKLFCPCECETKAGKGKKFLMAARFKRPLSDANDKVAFFVAFFTGIVGILAIRVLGDTFYKSGLNFIDFIAIAFAILIIVLYIFYIQSTQNRSSISVDRASDNIYYLGLLFTLTSLAYSLVKISIFTSEASVTTTDLTGLRGNRILTLLPDFGLALFSTIAGIFGRIYLQQLRSDPLDIETEAREELGRSVRELRLTIGEVVGQLNALSAQTRVSLTELGQNVSKTLEDTAKKSSDAYGALSDGINSVSEKMERQALEIVQYTENTSSRMGALISKLDANLNGLAEFPNSLSENFEFAAAKINELSEQLTSTAQTHKELSASIVASSGQVRSLFSEETWAAFSVELANAKNSISQLTAEITELGTTLANSAAAYGARAEQINTLGTSIENTQNAIKENTESIENASNAYIDALTESAEQLRNRTDKIR